MLFNSREFLYFFVIVYGAYLLLQKKYRWQNVLLLAASYFFYGLWDWRFLSLIFISTLVDYICALLMDTADARRRKLIITLSICAQLGLLAVFKYFNFFISSFYSMLGLFGYHEQSPALNILLPVGISFYTFHTMSYTIDVYRRHIQPTRRFFDFALSVAFFPQLVAGPIVRTRDLLPQLLRPRKLSLDQFTEGCFLIFWGLFEKMFIADSLAKIVNPVFAPDAAYTGSQVLMAVYAFSFQIFCDFDGYSNVARGLSKCMGIDIVINFNLPYFVTNPRDFWKRWHISLSTWLRDYLYIPLGGNRGGNSMLYRNLMLTMILGGLWHGASWLFVIWGIYQGVLLVGHRWIESQQKEKVPQDSAPVHILKIIGFYQLICLGWLIFRSVSLEQLTGMLGALFFDFQASFLLRPDFYQWFMIVLPLLIVQVIQYRKNDLMALYQQHWLIKTFAYALMFYLIIGWGVLKPQEFIYFQF